MDNCKVEINILGEGRYNRRTGKFEDNLLNDKNNPIGEMTSKQLKATCEEEATYVKIFITGAKAEQVANGKGQAFLAKYFSHFKGMITSKASKNGWFMSQSAEETRNDFDAFETVSAQ